MRVRSMSRFAWTLAPALALGCNSLLDNPTGQLAPMDAAASAEDASLSPNPGPDSGDTGSTSLEASVPDAAQVDDAALPPPPPGLDAGTVPTCGFGDKECNGACVQKIDPLYGCGPTTCSACSLTHATTTCSATGCAVAACDPGYADCDQVAANGCETDLSQATHCGTCNTSCPTTAPDCAPTASGFGCSTGCGTGAPTLCGTQCVSLTTSLDDCGACGKVCPAVGNGQASCTSGVCGFTCAADFHACGSACASDVSPATCGTSCAPCATEPNAVATCNGSQCGMACVAGFASCDGLTANGCEVDLLTDSANCGQCQVSCGGRACTKGVCAPPPDAGPPPPVDAGPPDAGAPPGDAGEDAASPPPVDAGGSPDAGD